MGVVETLLAIGLRGEITMFSAGPVTCVVPLLSIFAVRAVDQRGRS